MQLAALRAIEEAQRQAGGPLSVRQVQKLVQDGFLKERSKAFARRERESSKKEPSAVVIRVREVIERRAQLEDSDVRLLLHAISELDSRVAEFLSDRSLPKTRGAFLRALLFEAVFTAWAPAGSDAEATLRSAYGIKE